MKTTDWAYGICATIIGLALCTELLNDMVFNIFYRWL